MQKHKKILNLKVENWIYAIIEIRNSFKKLDSFMFFILFKDTKQDMVFHIPVALVIVKINKETITAIIFYVGP